MTTRVYMIEIRLDDVSDKKHETVKMLVQRAARGLRDSTDGEVVAWGDDFFKGHEDIAL